MNHLSIFDLPALHQRPSAGTLLATLESLALAPTAFDGPSLTNAAADPFRISKDAINYLTSIISSPLGWLPDDEAREVVWTVASQRLSERAGRSGEFQLCPGVSAVSISFRVDSLPSDLPSTTRTLEIPSISNPDEPPLKIHLHEPTLTAGNLGHKTWVAGYLLARRIPLLAAHVPLLRDPGTGQAVSNGATAESPGSKVPESNSPLCPLALELGSGTGLVGLSLAHRAPGLELHLTDLPEITPNLISNVQRNFPSTKLLPEIMNPREASIHVLPLDWNDVPESPASGTSMQATTWSPPIPRAQSGAYDLVIAADVLYGPEHPPLVARAAACFLKRHAEARVVVEVPIRERDAGLTGDLRREMQARKLCLRDEGQEEGWEEMGREEGRVICWWGIWSWESPFMDELRSGKQGGEILYHRTSGLDSSSDATKDGYT